MKKVIRANAAFKAEYDLDTKLYNDLVEDFEDNIVMQNASYINDDPALEYSYSEQSRMLTKLDQARSQYAKALADVIKYVDVDEFM